MENLRGDDIRYGKTIRTLWLVRYCIAAGKTLFIASNDPDFWYDRITKEIPEVKLIKHKDGVSIEKS